MGATRNFVRNGSITEGFGVVTWRGGWRQRRKSLGSSAARRKSAPTHYVALRSRRFESRARCAGDGLQRIDDVIFDRNSRPSRPPARPHRAWRSERSVR
jgi:hypothetical protein